MGKNIASAIACCDPELQEIRKLPLNNFPLGFLVAHSDEPNNGHLYNLVKERHFFTVPIMRF